MDFTSFKEIGIAVVSVGVMGYITFNMLKELAEARENYSSFVNSNNHTTTELVKEATRVMVLTGEVIKAHTDVIKSHTSVVEKLLDRLE